METKMLGPEACPEWGAVGDPAFGGVCLEKQHDQITFQKDNLAGALVRDEGTGGNGNGAVDGDL